VYYDEGFQDQGRLLANNYSAPLQELPATIEVAGQVAVVLGQDFAAAHPATPAAPATPASPGATVAPPPPPPPPPPAVSQAPPLVHACEE
jgi:hypothetical protein